MTTNARWLNEEEQALWRLLLAANRTIDRCLDDVLQCNGDLSISEYAVLVALSEAEEHQLRMHALCEQLEWDRSRASHQITRMARRGLVNKTKSPGDARGVVVCITQDGFNALEGAVPAHVESVRRLVFDHLDPADVATLQRFFQGVVDAAPAVSPDACPLPAAR